MTIQCPTVLSIQCLHLIAYRSLFFFFGILQTIDFVSNLFRLSSEKNCTFFG
jgi:hypothetical protein